MMIVHIGLAVVGVFLFMRLPTAFLPTEDQGFIMVSVQLPAGATKERTDATLAQVTQLAKAFLKLKTSLPFPASASRVAVQNMAMGFAMLKDWNERKTPGSDAESVCRQTDRHDDGYA